MSKAIAEASAKGVSYPKGSKKNRKMGEIYLPSSFLYDLFAPLYLFLF